MKILVLGGYGNFGARICRALKDDPAIELVVGGRDADQARGFAAELGCGAAGVAIDHSSFELAGELKRLGVELLIHTAGPYQGQGYAVARATALAGAHYVDLSDGRRFVCDFPGVMTDAFQKAGRTAICGASTVPALSSAIVDALCVGWQRVDAIDICIAPAQTAPRGKATLEGVLSYCGEEIQVWLDGRWQVRRGWALPEKVRFERLAPRAGALCDIPDLELFPSRYGVANRVMFRAALELGFTQRALAILAMLRTQGLVAHPARLAGFMNSAANAMNFLGSALGGMVVRVEGLDANRSPARRAWHIAADDDHGPEIPCMAAILLARKFARGESLSSSAFACMGFLKLEEFAPEFARWGMVTDIIDEGTGDGARTL